MPPSLMGVAWSWRTKYASLIAFCCRSFWTASQPSPSHRQSESCAVTSSHTFTPTLPHSPTPSLPHILPLREYFMARLLVGIIACHLLDNEWQDYDHRLLSDLHLSDFLLQSAISESSAVQDEPCTLCSSLLFFPYTCIFHTTYLLSTHPHSPPYPSSQDPLAVRRRKEWRSLRERKPCWSATQCTWPCKKSCGSWEAEGFWRTPSRAWTLSRTTNGYGLLGVAMGCWDVCCPSPSGV